jgi:C4-dicarboxylate-specific signal transduction histidine kinase
MERAAGWGEGWGTFDLSTQELGLEAQRLELDQEVLRAVSLLKAAQRLQLARVNLELPEDPVRVRVSRRRLEQVLLLLLTSAADAVKAGGACEVPIRLTVEPADVFGDAPPTFHVQDMGVGLGDEAMLALFAPGRRVGGPRRALPRARALVETMGGQLMVRGRGEVGLCVTVQLPGMGVASW